MAGAAIASILAALTGMLSWLALGIRGPAAVYPMIVLNTALVLLLATGFAEGRRRAPLGATDPELGALVSPAGGGLGACLAFAALWVTYPFVIPATGFIVATGITLSLSLVLLGMRRYLVIVLGVVLFTLALSVVMRLVIYVPMPAVGLDEALDRLLFALRTRG
jgi:hypothetical protein